MLMSRSYGFTIVELMVVLVIIAILATFAVPGFQDLLRSNRVASQSNELVALITLTRSEAVRRSRLVEIDLSSTPDGWDAVVRVLDPAEILRTATNTGVTLNDAPGQLVFNSRGYLVEPGSEDSSAWDTLGATFSLRHPGCTNARQHRQIRVLPTGQLNGTNENC